jgi:general secretion pathway protein G
MMNDLRWKRGQRNAFTLIELLLVMVILVILASIIVPKMTGYSEKARKTKAAADVDSFKSELKMFEIDCGRFPTSEEGLQALVHQPNGVQGYKQGGYMDGDVIPNDPWGNPYQYRCPGQHNPDGYDVFSMGPDGHEGGSDDIGNWTQ